MRWSGAGGRELSIEVEAGGVGTHLVAAVPARHWRAAGRSDAWGSVIGGGRAELAPGLVETRRSGPVDGA